MSANISFTGFVFHIANIFSSGERNFYLCQNFIKRVTCVFTLFTFYLIYCVLPVVISLLIPQISLNLCGLTADINYHFTQPLNGLRVWCCLPRYCPEWRRSRPWQSRGGDTGEPPHQAQSGPSRQETQAAASCEYCNYGLSSAFPAPHRCRVIDYLFTYTMPPPTLTPALPW